MQAEPTGSTNQQNGGVEIQLPSSVHNGIKWTAGALPKLPPEVLDGGGGVSEVPRENYVFQFKSPI